MVTIGLNIPIELNLESLQIGGGQKLAKTGRGTFAVYRKAFLAKPSDHVEIDRKFNVLQT